MEPPPPRHPTKASELSAKPLMNENSATNDAGMESFKKFEESSASFHHRNRSGEPKSPKIQCMVDKAKSAAAQIWLLLHSRACSDQSCQVVHCKETKQVYRLARLVQQQSHTNKPLALTQLQEKGILQARKLLQHYHECRIARKNSTPKSPHFCLVCSLVARARMAPTDGTSLLPGGAGGKRPRSLSLDFSASPYDPSLPTPSLLPPRHGHRTRNGGYRRRSSSWDTSQTRIAAIASKKSSRSKFVETSSSSSSSSSSRIKSHRRRRSLSMDSQPPTEDYDSLHIGASLLSGLGQSRHAVFPVEGDTRSDCRSKKRHRSASWGGEWRSELNTAQNVSLEEETITVRNGAPIQPRLRSASFSGPSMISFCANECCDDPVSSSDLPFDYSTTPLSPQSHKLSSTFYGTGAEMFSTAGSYQKNCLSPLVEAAVERSPSSASPVSSPRRVWSRGETKDPSLPSLHSPPRNRKSGPAHGFMDLMQLANAVHHLPQPQKNSVPETISQGSPPRTSPGPTSSTASAARDLKPLASISA